MPLAPADLLDPLGRVTPEMFPQDTPEALASRVTAYLAAAYADARVAAMDAGEREDEAARQYAYSRAFNAVADRLAVDPASTTLEAGGSESYSSDQRAYWRAQAGAAWAAFLSTATPRRVDRDTGGSFPISVAWG